MNRVTKVSLITKQGKRQTVLKRMKPTMLSSLSRPLLCISICCTLVCVSTFSFRSLHPRFHRSCTKSYIRKNVFFASTSSDEEFGNERDLEYKPETSKGNDEEAAVAESVVRVDDGGSDLTDRFKYKVNALMGTYDPVGSATDDENQSGNILNAMLTFPTRYTFNVVGRTGGNAEAESKYVEDVKTIIEKGLVLNEKKSNVDGDANSNDGVSFSSNEVNLDKGIECSVTPRGKNFVKISAEVTVESAAVISSIYEDLSEMKLTVMNF